MCCFQAWSAAVSSGIVAVTLNVVVAQYMSARYPSLKLAVTGADTLAVRQLHFLPSQVTIERLVLGAGRQRYVRLRWRTILRHNPGGCPRLLPDRRQIRLHQLLVGGRHAGKCGSGEGPGTLSALVDSAQAWSDWNGQPSSANAAALNAAAVNATVVGLSFGGGCFFENGVGTSDGSGSFTLSSFTRSPAGEHQVM